MVAKWLAQLQATAAADDQLMLKIYIIEYKDTN